MRGDRIDRRLDGRCERESQWSRSH
jgi:hypothetical protein